jgi:hypothetical protein
LIRGSSLEGESIARGPAMSASVSNEVDPMLAAVEERFATPLAASLVDLAMSQLKLKAM